ncbi:S8 family serine peptidase [Eubacterium oxidoreducens]|uniref:Cell wall-associated protease n=1 Tax=Eubacterium oxidoreducens TaxID=1732 RepID=A0A1G6BTP8_EUBOX|nr:S8 family serine peptidase [Eubacterium oxidoreducens]SDB23927.1 cell wall-associated protease [Eubacterium oxidoreducens]
MKKFLAFVLIAGMMTGFVPVSVAANTAGHMQTQDGTEITIVNSVEERMAIEDIQADLTDAKKTCHVNLESGKVYDSEGTETSLHEELGISKEKEEDFFDGTKSENKKELKAYLEDQGIYTTSQEGDVLTIGYPYQLKRVIVDADALESGDQLISTYNAKAVIYDSTMNHYILSYDTEKETKNAYDNLAQEYGTTYVCPDILVSAYETATSASTSSTTTDWGVTTMGLDEATQDAESGSQEVVVAVLDTGIYEDHELFEGRILSDLSYSYITQSSSQGPFRPWESSYGTTTDTSDVDDDNGHGTHVAGIIAQGTSSNVKLMIVKVMDANGSGSLEDIASAVTYATQNGADIINISAGAEGVYSSYASSCGLESALASAKSQGVFTAVASGNESEDIEDAYCYPAYSSYVYTVGSVNSSLTVSSYSNYGSSLDFVTPGENITSASTTGTSAYVTYSGTSMATPYLSAAAAMEKTLYGALDESYDQDDIYAALKSISTDLGDSGYDVYYGYGMPSFLNTASQETSKGVSSSSWTTKTITITASNGAKLKYKITKNTKTATLKSVVTQKSKITVPATISYDGVTYKVTAIGAKAFSGKKKIKTVVIGKNVTTIGKKAFYNATNLKTIKIKSKNLTSVKTGAFKKIKEAATIYLPSSKYKKYKTMIKKTTSSTKIKYKKR